MYVNELINNYAEEKVITYKGEHYSVRDNGAIKRHALMPEMPRPLDEIWTYIFFDADSLVAQMVKLLPTMQEIF